MLHAHDFVSLPFPALGPPLSTSSSAQTPVHTHLAADHCPGVNFIMEFDLLLHILH